MSDSSFLPIGSLLVKQYKILQHIGAGGFGKTYLVEDQLGEKKVVKEFFISSMCTRDAATQSVTVSVDENRQSFQEQLTKFKEEARRIYSLSHPNIVKVSALFDENDTAYYVMNYIEGESLAQKSKRERLSESQIRRYLDQLLSALDYIHSQGVTHLDIKPGNIMIDRNDNVVLIDFGASKLFNAQSVNKTMMTSMRPPFTPGYAPIEQENGDVSDMGPHCDIYALGATLYNLFTGEKAPLPFVIFQKGLPQIPQASPLMQKVIKEAMAFDANHRIKNVAEFRAMLGGKRQMTQPVVGSEETKVAQNQDAKNDTAKTLIAQPSETVRQETIKQTSISSASDRADKDVAKKQEEEGEDKKDWIKVSVLLILAIMVILVIGLLASKNGVKTVDGDALTDTLEVKHEENKIKYENKTITIPGTNVSFNMVFVEGGTFQMGSNDSEAHSDEKPVHSVTLNDYYIGETEVTQELWEAVMGSNPSVFKGSKKPVEMVSWNNCQEFIMKLNRLTGRDFRLPTEAEWEYAARGGNKSQGYKYSGSNTIDDVAWYDENSLSTHPVGTKAPNELGLYDMSGNVWEWCSDWYGDYSSSSQTNPTGSSSGSGRVLRGGSWCRDAQCCRVAFRDNNALGLRFDYNGFRLVCSRL